MPDNAILLTGATGFVGAELLARIIDAGERPVVALVRADDDTAAQARVDELVATLVDPVPEPGRIRAVASDLTADGLGLDESTLAWIAEEVTTVVHCAASVSFSLSLPESRVVNVEGTRRMLDVARRCAGAGDGLERFAYISTAYVSGCHNGTFGPGDLERGQRYRNPYEQSKQEAEVLVQAAWAEFPIQVFRPSIVVGDRHTGWTNSFNVLYQPLRAFSRGLYSTLPGRMGSPVDVVPVDYVADGICALLTEPIASPQTHLLVSGDQAPTVGELVAAASGYFDRPPPRIVDPRLFRWVLEPILRRRGGPMMAVLEHSGVYFPYFAVQTRFSDPATEQALSAHGIDAPRLSEYLPRLLDFAVQCKWGKRLPNRAEIFAANAA